LFTGYYRPFDTETSCDITGISYDAVSVNASTILPFDNQKRQNPDFLKQDVKRIKLEKSLRLAEFTFFARP
jgi:hypothetical protein